MEKSEYRIIRKFIDGNFHHFNAGVVARAANSYSRFVENGGTMMVALAGAMSTAGIGCTLARMIRRGRVHAISATGANLEEELFRMLAVRSYKKVSEYRELSAKEESELFANGLNRVTDVCIPETEGIQAAGRLLMDHWQDAERKGSCRFPHDYFYDVVLSGRCRERFQISPEESWLAAAAESQLPLFIPGWENSSMGNIFSAALETGTIGSANIVKSGIEYARELRNWYRGASRNSDMGFFQIGGGIAGDFGVSVVPVLIQELGCDVAKWKYFCQISDSTTSYGSYSGAVPNEKITWGKLTVSSERFVIESDATIVAPLIFGYVLGDEELR